MQCRIADRNVFLKKRPSDLAVTVLVTHAESGLPALMLGGPVGSQ